MRQSSFALNIREWCDKAEGAIDDTLRAIVIELGSAIIRATPVDTGRARGSWQFSLDTPSVGQVDNPDQEGAETIAKLAAEANKLTAGQTAYIVSTLVYMIELEYGHSTQAPEGMVRTTIAHFQKIVRDAAAEHRV
ncbi:HK97 gp10 family phage protein [Pseudomonas sp.]|uniref:HK97 gp10 family phage protein n=1 Tax=Pseudomonas sp. TaxID=306 RepID=UPI00289D6889|nr:HK97 gp10 family phage protein [Pseudomonas sp.]